VPFTSTHCFLGRTANVDYLESHYSVLMPGCSPHPPHAHLDEEILVVMHGTAELVVPAAQGNEPEIFPAPAGTAIYYPSYQLHTIRNPSQEPVSYAMLRWRSNAPAAKRGLWPQLLQGSWLRKENIPGPVAMKGIVDGPSVWLGKLHAHITRLQPGAGYGAHRDEHDVVIFLLEGAFELMNARIAAPALVFLPAGCLHDMKALGPGLTKYLVWEFHRTDPEYPAVESHIATAGGAYLSPEAAE
jgi:mannose-6-phosphate isomerase-like protein (cupin superfamily)